ncbi:MAG: hypothetical protein ACKVKX_09495 [Pseudomonadales bacterium]
MKRHSSEATSLQRSNVTPAKERHPSKRTSPQQKNVTPAKERHPSGGWGDAVWLE